MAVIFVTHDVGVACEVADRVAVMYAGRLVESGSVAAVMQKPQHPYTAGLLGSIVHGQTRDQRIEAIPGAPPDLADLPAGCSFAPRCKFAADACRAEVPAARQFGGGRLVRCVLADAAVPA
jgi:peptide/nickel transport system ATP-binding protein